MPGLPNHFQVARASGGETNVLHNAFYALWWWPSAHLTSPPYIDLIDYIEEDIAQIKTFFNYSEIKNLKEKYKIGLLSNNSETYTKEYLFRPKMDKLFDVLVLSHLEGIRKPEPKIYLLLAERMGLKPEEILYLDDQPSRLAPAKELGFKVLLYEGPKTDEILERIAI